MTTYLGKSCSFGLPRVPFVNCRQFMYLVISLLVLRAGCGIWLYQFLIIACLFTFYNIYWEAIRSIQFLVLNTGSHVNGRVKMFLLSFCQTSSSAKHKLNWFAVINNGVMVLNLNSIVPIKTRFAHGKRHSALHKCLALKAVSKTTSSFNQKTPANDFKLISKFYLSQIISLWIKMTGN